MSTRKRRLFLGLDVGTQSTKGLVLDAEHSTVVARAGASYGFVAGLPDGHREQHPETWIAAISDVIRDLLHGLSGDGREIEGIGVSGQQHGAVLLDQRGKPVRAAKLWCDTSTASIARDLSLRLKRRIPCGYTASKLVYVREHEPEVWEKVRTVLLPHDYVNFWLTGTLAMEAGDASGTGFFDAETREFDSVLMDAMDPGLCALMPRVLPPGAVLGRVSNEVALATGLPLGTPVSVGGGDNMMSALGSGATEPGVLVISLGTSGTAFTYSPKPVRDAEGLVAEFCDSTGGHLPLLCIMNLTGVTEEVRTAFGFGGPAGLKLLSEEAARVAIGCDGVSWIPFLGGERVPDLPEAQGSLHGLRYGSLRAPLLFRAAMEGTTFNLHLGIEHLQRLGIPMSRVHAVGGGSKSSLWRQMLADVLNVPIHFPTEPDSAALGAAISAVWAIEKQSQGRLSANDVAKRYVKLESTSVLPLDSNVASYGAPVERWRAILRTLFGGGVLMGLNPDR